MSAFQVDNDVIRLLAVWAVSDGCKDPTTKEVNAAAKTLWEANDTSLKARYGEGCMGKPPKVTKAQISAAQKCPAVVVIKQGHCLEYQSCEYDEWGKSTARDLVLAAIDNVSHRIDGYDDAPWGNFSLRG